MTGPAGAGASTVAQALAAHHTGQARTLLADLALDADQHLRHGVRPGHDGVFELAEALRHAPPADLAPPTTDEGAGYDLLCGLRRRQEWTALTAVVADQIVDVLRRSHRLVVADVSADLDGRAESGSLDLEERNALARATLPHAAIVVVVGRWTTTGVHRLVRTLVDLTRHGIDHDRLQPVLNDAPEQQSSPGPGLPDDDCDPGRRRPRAMARPDLPRPRPRRRTLHPRGEATPGSIRPPGRPCRRSRRDDRDVLAPRRHRAAGPGAGRPGWPSTSAVRTGRLTSNAWSSRPSTPGTPNTGTVVAPSPSTTTWSSGPSATSPATARSSPLLDDDDVWEIMVNAPDADLREAAPRRRRATTTRSSTTTTTSSATLTKILDDAAGAHRKLDPSEGLQDAQLDDGARLHIVHGDISRGGHVMVNIRKFTGVAFRRLDELVERGHARPGRRRLPGRVRAGRRLSIVVRRARPGRARPRCCPAAPPSSTRRCGSSSPRRCSRPTSRCRTSPACRPAAPRPDRPGVDLRRLVAGFLRMAPDVAIVGEVRDREALPLLLTLSSGVKGSPRSTPARPARRSPACGSSASSPTRPPTSAAGGPQHAGQRGHRRRRALRRGPDGPRVTEVVAVEDLAAGDAGGFTATPLVVRPRPDRPLEWSGLVPDRLTGRLAPEASTWRRILADRGSNGRDRPGLGVPSRPSASTSSGPVPLRRRPPVGPTPSNWPAGRSPARCRAARPVLGDRSPSVGPSPSPEAWRRGLRRRRPPIRRRRPPGPGPPRCGPPCSRSSGS